MLVDDPLADVYHPRFSPDGATVVCVRESLSTYAEPPDYTLLLVDVAGGDRVGADPGLRPVAQRAQFSADGSAVYFLADDDGRHAVFRVPVGGGAPVRLTGDGAYSDLNVARDGSALYALRSAPTPPPLPVRLDPEAPHQEPPVLPSPGRLDPLPGTLHQVEATAADGARVQSWLVLPEGASADNPAPLLLWIHGGPLMSWNSWSWRWCPWVMVARGYAVLLPNPALSQGFGLDFVRRGWGEWGGAPYTDLMAAVDAAVERPDVDATRTAAMGGSFGGYMANWVATQTDRFRAIVTHASLWDLDSFIGSTDAAYYWEKEWGDPLTEPKRYEQNSPHRYADAIRTPMLVIHGDKDYRVPIGEGLRLWSTCRSAACPRSSSTSPTRTTGCSRPATRSSGTRRCWPSWPSTSSTRSGSGPTCSDGRPSRVTGRSRRRVPTSLLDHRAQFRRGQALGQRLPEQPREGVRRIDRQRTRPGPRWPSRRPRAARH